MAQNPTQGALAARIFESSGWGVLVVGRWSRKRPCNRGTHEISGIPAADAVARPVGEVFGQLRGLDLESLDAEVRETGRFETRSLRLERPSVEVVFRHLRGDVLAGGAGTEEAVVVSVQDVTERGLLRLCMSCYLDREVVDLVLSCCPDEPVAGQELAVAVLVADTRGSTDTAEGLTPEGLFETRNAYLEPMVEIAVRHRGMVDKSTGDDFMAVFGVPCATGSEPELPLTAAVELADAVEASSRQRERAGSPRLGLGYGVH